MRDRRWWGFEDQILLYKKKRNNFSKNNCESWVWIRLHAWNDVHVDCNELTSKHISEFWRSKNWVLLDDEGKAFEWNRPNHVIQLHRILAEIFAFKWRVSSRSWSFWCDTAHVRWTASGSTGTRWGKPRTWGWGTQNQNTAATSAAQSKGCWSMRNLLNGSLSARSSGRKSWIVLFRGGSSLAYWDKSWPQPATVPQTAHSDTWRFGGFAWRLVNPRCKAPGQFAPLENGVESKRSLRREPPRWWGTEGSRRARGRWLARRGPWSWCPPTCPSRCRSCLWRKTKNGLKMKRMRIDDMERERERNLYGVLCSATLLSNPDTLIHRSSASNLQN